MKTKWILATLGLVAGIAGVLPVPAVAGGPLLSGYGGPGAGDQAIIGAALIGGPSGGGSGGGSGDSGSGAPSVAASSAASGSGGGAPSGGPAAGGGSAEGRGSSSHSSATARAHSGSATHHRAAGANPQSSTPHRGGLGAVTADEAAESWFSGGDWLALVLVSGVLALLALTTVRLTRTRHE